MNQININLYSTSHCHLCEEAEKLILRIPFHINYSSVEICDDIKLMEKYGTRIPVLKRLDNGIELGWPFTENEIVSFLTQI